MWFHKKRKLDLQGLAPALGVVAYVLAFTTLITNGNKLFPHINQTLAPLMFLTLFCFSVLVCGLTVFYQPYLLFVQKKTKEAACLVAATTMWLGVLAIIIMSVVAAFSR